MLKEYRLAENTIDNKDLRELAGWLTTNPWLTQGPLVKEFESQWASWLGTKYATFVNSGSSANLLMYYALLLSGRLCNTKVVVPAVSWATTVAPAIQLGFEPIMCDADAEDFGLDMRCLEYFLKKEKPAAVCTVHVLGVPNKMADLMKLKQKYGFVLMEDTCAAHGSRYDGKKVGTFGEVSTFSFYFGHHISTIEGGMVCTNDDQLHDIFLHTRSHGWAKDLDPAKEEALTQEHGVLPFNRVFTFYYPGFNVRSTDLNARIGLSQMRKLDWVVQRRIENHRVYQSRFLDAGWYVQCNEHATICSISFAAMAESPEHRDRIARALRANRIETRPLGGGNMSRQPFWLDRYGAKVFRIADRIHTTGFQLPNHPYLKVEDVNHICDVVLAVRNG
jgi:CDP-6-deoxy-D-xylo-4-hexulose-3-dehydrase